MNKRNIFLLTSLLFFPCLVNGQENMLTLSDAIQQALSGNYGLKAISNLEEKAENNNTAGNAGMLPSVGLSGGYAKSNNNLNQKFANGLEVDRSNVGATNANASAGLTWVIFDGMRMFYTKDQLDQLSEQAQLIKKEQIESTVQLVISSYYTIVRNKQLLKATREQILLAEERLKIAERKLNNGSGSKLDLLQAQTELNRQRASELSIRDQSDEAKINLNRLMGRDPSLTFDTEDTVPVNYRPTLEQLKSTVRENNTLLRNYKVNNRIAALQLNATKGQRWPVVSFNSQYNFIRSTSEAGFSLLNQQHGLQYGVTASIPLFNGFNLSRQIKNARLDVLTTQLQLDEAEQEIQAQLINAWRSYQNSLEALKLEEDNIRFAREVLTISQERYKVGSSNAVELQDAQQTYEDAMSRLANARYSAKVNETELKKLNGELVTTLIGNSDRSSK